MTTLARTAILAPPVFGLFALSVVRVARRRSASAVSQLVGAICFVLVVSTHLAEGLRLFPAMRWGEPDSIGHYIDLTSAVLGIALMLLASLLRAKKSGASGAS